MRRVTLLALAAALAAAGLTAAVGAQYSDVDLREANVMGVAWEGAAGEYRFDVTLYHDDDGEDGYADWWQVETLEGERLGRRTLAHPHGTEPFTRSGNVSIPVGVSTVVVRGHDSTHGYGGRAVVVDLENGTARVVEQGSEPDPFHAADATDGGSNVRAPPVRDGEARENVSAPNGSDDPPDDGRAQDGDAAATELPGYGVAAAVLAALASALLARRRCRSP